MIYSHIVPKYLYILTENIICISLDTYVFNALADI